MALRCIVCRTKKAKIKNFTLGGDRFCRACIYLMDLDYRTLVPEEITIASRKNYYEAHPEVVEKMRQYSIIWQRNNPERTRLYKIKSEKKHKRLHNSKNINTISV